MCFKKYIFLNKMFTFVGVKTEKYVIESRKTLGYCFYHHSDSSNGKFILANKVARC